MYLIFVVFCSINYLDSAGTGIDYILLSLEINIDEGPPLFFSPQALSTLLKIYSKLLE
jgi:hypothetical protein